MRHNTALLSGVPILFIGHPGVGKSAALNAWADSLGFEMETLIGSIMDPIDIGGQQVKVNGHVDYIMPGWFHRLSGAKQPVLFNDEITTCPPATQAAMLRLIQEKAIHGNKLPEKTIMVSAANPPEEAAGGWDLAPPMANRFCHLRWEADLDVFTAGMIADWPEPKARTLPKNWEAGIPAMKAQVAAFVKARPHLLHAMPTEEAQRSGPWPSPRSWEMVARLLGAYQATGEDATEVVAGCVGDGAAAEFLQWREALDLPDPEAVLKAPDKFTLPERGDIAFAVLSAVVSAVIQKNTVERWNAGWEVVAKAVEQDQPDIGAAAAQALAVNVPEGKDGKRPIMPKVVAEFLPMLKEAGEFGH